MAAEFSLKQISAIVLAAGLSRRAAPHNKLLLPAASGDRTVVRATVEAMCGAGFGEVLVVTGHEREKIEHALVGLPVRYVFAADFRGGMGHSLAAGVRAAARDASGFAITPGDLPLLETTLVQAIAAAFMRAHGAAHVIPLANGERGHPVIIGGWLRPGLETLSGDQGARRLLSSADEKARCTLLEVNNPAILRDVDTPPP